jgi:O-antigen/teichoic acid export membrane protein
MKIQRVSTRDTGIFLFGTLLQQVVTFVTGIFVARWLGPDNYGILSITRNVFTVVMIVAPLGLDLSLLRHLSEIDGNDAKSLTQVRSLRLLVACFTGLIVLLIAFLVGPWLESHVYHQPGFCKYLIITFIALPFMADIAIMTAVFRAHHNPAPQLFVSLYIQPLVRFGGIITFLLMGLGLAGVICGTVLGSVVACGLISLLFARFIKSKKILAAPFGRDDVLEIRKLLSYSIWMAMTLIVYVGLKSIDILSLGFFRPSKEVGNYAALSAFAQLIPIASQSLSQTLGPTVAKLYQQGKIREMGEELGSYLRNASLMTGPIFAGVAAFGPWLDIIFGPKYHFTPQVSVMLSAGYYLSAVLAPMGYSLSMTGRHRLEFSVLASGTVIVLFLSWLLVPPLGSIGAALTILIGYLLINFVRYYIVRKIYNLSIGGLKDVIPPLCCLVIGEVISNLGLIIGKSLFTLCILGIIYLVLVFLIFKTLLLSSEEKAYFARKIPFLKRKPLAK